MTNQQQQHLTLEQLKSTQEPDGSITLEDASTKEKINYVLLPEEAKPCVIAHPWAYAAGLKQQTPFQRISGANNLCFWRCEILKWALRRAMDVAAVLDGDTASLEKQLKTDQKEGTVATEKSVASAALYLGLRITVLHEDMTQAWTFLGETGNPVGLSYIFKLKSEHFTLGKQIDLQPHALRGASYHVMSSLREAEDMTQMK
eukprot:2617172-Amphidinium_carterae.1